MISRGAPVGAICFRCRLRLLHRTTPLRYVTNDAANAAANAADNVRRTEDQADGNGATEGGDREYRPLARGRHRTGFKQIKLKKSHISGNRVLNEVSASLSMDVLGEPGYAIVMKDGGQIQRKGFPVEPVEEDDKTPDNLPANIEAVVDSQREPPTLDEVRRNIQDLQPKTETSLSKKDFRTLQNLLVQGFLGAQLYDYIEWHKLNTKGKSGRPTESPAHPWIVYQSPWMPLQANANPTQAADFLPAYMTHKTPLKERLAIRLMLECWGLSISELQGQLGETQITLRSEEFALLMRGTQRYLNTLTRTYLEPPEVIEAFREQETLRLVTTRSKTKAIISDLNAILENVTTKTFPLVLVNSENPSDAILEELGHITNSLIRKSQTGRRGQLHVTWIEVKSRAARGLDAVEDVAHIVLRLLLTSSQPPRTTSNLLGPTTPEADAGRLIMNDANSDKLRWKDRLAQWGRYVHPLTQARNVSNAELPIEKFELPFESSRRPDKFDPDGVFFPETQFPRHPVLWSKELQTSTVARFGQILHPHQSSNPTSHLSSLLAGSADRCVFAATTPHPLRLAELEVDGLTFIKEKSTIVVNFWPSPSSNPSSSEPKSKSQSETKTKTKSTPTSSKSKKSSRAGDAPPAPRLELRLTTPERDDQDIVVESLRAITRTHHIDVMRPSSLVDVRFTQTQYATLRARDYDTLAAWQPIADFLNDARIELQRGKLELPPRKRFAIPTQLLAVTPPTKQDEDAELVGVSYEFVGLELHHSVAIPYGGHLLTYTSIEAGLGGGRRVEATLEPLDPHDSTPPPPSTEAASTPTDTEEAAAAAAVDKDRLLRDFLECCSAFAADRALWTGLGGKSGPAPTSNPLKHL